MAEKTSVKTRKRLTAAEVETHQANGTIIEDDRRRQTLWFDGRFLDAQALKTDQNYFRSRLADVTRVIGVGVVQGLMVTEVQVKNNITKSRTVAISAGHGVTPAGDLVYLPEDLEVDLANVAESQLLDASFGLAELPRQAMHNRSGLFVIGLRPVEYAAEPITSYPTSITGDRSVEEGSIIEATAVTLIPYPDQGARTELEKRRMHVAKEIFVDASKKGQPADILPVAMIALNLGVIQWVDPYLVRRDAGSVGHDIFGLGLSPRVLREAFLKQYNFHLSELLSEQQNGRTRFAASDNFMALPPAGPLPVEAVNVDDFTQLFFPEDMDVELTIIPADELSAMLEESFSLPPLDLTLTGDEYESTSILIMIPLERHEVRQFALSLKSVIQPLKAPVPGMVFKRQPIWSLTDLANRRLAEPAQSVVDTAKNVWRKALGKTNGLWYTRRRNLQYKAEIVSIPVPITRDEEENEVQVEATINRVKVQTLFKSITDRSTIAARAEMMTLLGGRKFIDGSNILVRAAVSEIHSFDPERVNRATVVNVATRFTKSKLGEGVRRLEDLEATFRDDEKVVNSVSASGKVPELDHIAQVLSSAKLKVFSNQLLKAATTGTAPEKQVAKLVDDKMNELKSPTKIVRSLQ
ncbi:MAG: hypothetical protein L6365_05645 [Desulfobulbaceae bacterium]|nr:hypothetical protein [Pseudomonadota bacterium]MCG2746996.1 hypothetical protein [Desulfobulbaceae bacterium]